MKLSEIVLSHGKKVGEPLNIHCRWVTNHPFQVTLKKMLWNNELEEYHFVALGHIYGEDCPEFRGQDLIQWDTRLKEALKDLGEGGYGDGGTQWEEIVYLHESDQVSYTGPYTYRCALREVQEHTKRHKDTLYWMSCLDPSCKNLEKSKKWMVYSRTRDGVLEAQKTASKHFETTESTPEEVAFWVAHNKTFEERKQYKEEVELNHSRLTYQRCLSMKEALETNGRYLDRNFHHLIDEYMKLKGWSK